MRTSQLFLRLYTFRPSPPANRLDKEQSPGVDRIFGIEVPAGATEQGISFKGPRIKMSKQDKNHEAS